MEENGKKNGALRIPYALVSIIALIIIQTMGAIWWASMVNTKLDYIQKVQIDSSSQITEIVKTRYDSNDATKNWGDNNSSLLRIETHLSSLTDMVIKYQSKNSR